MIQFIKDRLAELHRDLEEKTKTYQEYKQKRQRAGGKELMRTKARINNYRQLLRMAREQQKKIDCLEKIIKALEEEKKLYG